MTLFRSILFLFISVSMLACGKSNSSKISNQISNRISLGYIGPTLPTVCNILDNNIYSGITVSGKAEYEYRTISVTTGSQGLREVSGTPKPIRGAEFIVQNGNKEKVFCGYTDNLGQFSFNLPQDNQFYKLIVKSRDETFANVMRAPETNDLYEITYNFTANGNKTNLSLIAEGSNTVIGAAFNILDQIYESTSRIESLTSGITCNGSNCLDINTIAKVDIYWEKGFNPGSYLQGSPALSFYNRDFNRIFILGGLNGDIDFSDTDHFDNSIIIHEYFHSIESALSKTNSPGGLHNGNQLLDPRLAWSEGVAQFFQALVTNIPAVLDTRGNVEGSTGFFLNLSVEHRTNDTPLNPGEGEFREFSVARTLWDLYDSNADSPFDASGASNVSLNFFEKFWRALTGNAEGFNGVSENFRTSSLLHKLAEENDGAALPASWKEVLVQDLHMNGENGTFVRGDPDSLMTPGDPADVTVLNRYRRQYGQKLNVCGSGTALHMFAPFYCNADYTGAGPCIDNSRIEAHHSLQNSDYYHLIHSGGNLEMSFVDSTLSPSGVKTDLDIYVYREGYAIDGGSRSTPFASSTNLNVSSVHNTSETETITNLPSGEYLIQIFIRNFAASSNHITYSFTGLCPEGP